MGKTITLRDIKTGEALYPDVLVTNTYDSEGNNLVSILSEKADLVGGVIPLSQLPEIIVNGDGLVKEVVVNNVTVLFVLFFAMHVPQIFANLKI